MAHKKLWHMGNSIWETTSWADLVDSLFVYTYIAKAQENEVIVEEKCERDDEASKTSKIATRINIKKNEELVQRVVPTQEVQMEDAVKDKNKGKP